MECRIGCGVCCTVVSISSPIPGMPNGKPAGIRCVQLSADDRCLLFGLPERPPVCSQFQALEEHCGISREDAFRLLSQLESDTRP